MINIDRTGVEDERGVTLEIGSTDGAVIDPDTSTWREERHAEAGEILTEEEVQDTGGRSGDGTGDDRPHRRYRRAAEDLHVAGDKAGEGLSI